MTKLRSVTVVGSGTSTGVPVLGCDCAVCSSTNPRNQRMRASLALEAACGEVLWVDTGPDFRTQGLRYGLKDLRYVFYTHTHADHCHGFDDLRAFYFHSGQPVTCFVPEPFVEDFCHKFAYALNNTGYLGTAPQVKVQPFGTGPLQIGPFALDVAMFPHGNVETAGFRCGAFAYVTDFKTFPDATLTAWRDHVRFMVASGNNFNLDHHTHSTVQETAEILRRMNVERGAIGHLSHEVDYDAQDLTLPPGIELAYDGLKIDLSQ